jgi:hypothetical protein
MYSNVITPDTVTANYMNVIKFRSQISRKVMKSNTGKRQNFCVTFEVYTAVTVKNGTFWDVTPCGSC